MINAGKIFLTMKSVFAALNHKRFYTELKHWKFFRLDWYHCYPAKYSIPAFHVLRGLSHLLKFVQPTVTNHFNMKLGVLPFFFPALSPILEVHSAEHKPSNYSDKQRDKEIVELLKQAKILVSKTNYAKAEFAYLQALRLAVKKDDPALVAYIQDLLANLALETNQLDKAEPLYKDVLKNLIAHGKADNDPSVIEVSLKLASVYARMGKKELAISGYKWCSNTCQKSIEDMKKKNVADDGFINMKVLLGMILDSHGRYLHDIGENRSALFLTLQALDISLEVFGELHDRRVAASLLQSGIQQSCSNINEAQHDFKQPETIVLYNDLASITMDMGDYSKAYDYVQKAITISEANPKLALPSEKAVFYSNLAYIYIKQGKIKQAELAYKQALLQASKSNDKQLQSQVASLVHAFPKKE